MDPQVICKFDEILDSFEARKHTSIVKEVTPRCARFTQLRRVLKDKLVIETEVRVLKLHLSGVDFLALERITAIFFQEIVQLLVLLKQFVVLWVKDHFLRCPSLT